MSGSEDGFYCVEISAKELRVLYGYARDHIRAMSKSPLTSQRRRTTAELLLDAIDHPSLLLREKVSERSKTISVAKFDEYDDDPWITELLDFAKAVADSTDGAVVEVWVEEMLSIQAAYGLSGETRDDARKIELNARRLADEKIEEEQHQVDYYLRRVAIIALLGHGALALAVASALLNRTINSDYGIWLFRLNIVGLVLAALHPFFMLNYQQEVIRRLHFEKTRLSLPPDRRSPPKAFLKNSVRAKALLVAMVISIVTLLYSFVLIAVVGPQLLVEFAPT